MKNLPIVSIIIPTYNEEIRLPACLESIRQQSYPQNKIEIIVVDDGSEDNTVGIAKKYGAKIYKNGAKNIERGKSIGIENTTGELLLFLDADNQLIGKDWLSKTVNAFKENPKALGAEAIWFKYRKDRPSADRYCQLFGINDPFPFYLKRQDRLMAYEKTWNLKGKVLKETANYFLLEFNKDNLPTVGSQGYLIRKANVLKTSWKPYFFHMDTHTQLLSTKSQQFVMMKLNVGHDHCDSILSFLKKVTRNGRLFLQQNKQRSFRYSPDSSLKPIVITGLICSSVVIPMLDALRGYLKKRDLAWFFHPFFCFATAVIYAKLFIQWKIGKL